MSNEEFNVKGKGFSLNFLLKSGGIRVFVWFDLAVGIICIIFGFLNPKYAFIPFLFWAFITYKIYDFLIKTAKTKKGWVFFLDTHYLFKYFELQMSLTGDKRRGTIKLSEGQQVQPILNSGNIITEASQGQPVSIMERSAQ